MHADALLPHAPRSLEWMRAELAPPGPGEVWLETLAGAISVGTEVPLYGGDAREAAPLSADDRLREPGPGSRGR